MVVNLASKFHVSDPCSFRDTTFFYYFFNFSKNLDIKNFLKIKNLKNSNFEVLNVFVGIGEDTLRVENLASENDCSNLCSFRDLMSFRIFQRTKIFNYLVRLFHGNTRSCDFCFQI